MVFIFSSIQATVSSMVTPLFLGVIQHLSPRLISPSNLYHWGYSGLLNCLARKVQFSTQLYYSFTLYQRYDARCYKRTFMLFNSLVTYKDERDPSRFFTKFKYMIPIERGTHIVDLISCECGCVLMNQIERYYNDWQRGKS